jgi:hypothetical protein
MSAAAAKPPYIAAGHGWVIDLDLEKFLSRQTDGSERQTSRRQAAAETHPGIF